MKKKLKRTEVWNWKPYVAALVLLVVCVLVAVGPSALQEQIRSEACNQELQLHPVRVYVTNGYDQAIWLQVEYSAPGSRTETWMIPEGAKKIVVYTKYGFPEGSNVTVTFRAVDPTTQRFLSNQTVTFQITPQTPLVYDEKYHEWVTETRTGTDTTTTTTLDLQCVTTQVFQGPTFTVGPGSVKSAGDA